MNHLGRFSFLIVNKSSDSHLNCFNINSTIPNVINFGGCVDSFQSVRVTFGLLHSFNRSSNKKLGKRKKWFYIFYVFMVFAAYFEIFFNITLLLLSEEDEHFCRVQFICISYWLEQQEKLRFFVVRVTMLMASKLTIITIIIIIINIILLCLEF